MIHSYLMDNKFARINMLLDQYCRRCQDVHEDIACSECHLEHRKNNISEPLNILHDTENMRLTQFKGA